MPLYVLLLEKEFLKQQLSKKLLFCHQKRKTKALKFFFVSKGSVCYSTGSTRFFYSDEARSYKQVNKKLEIPTS